MTVKSKAIKKNGRPTKFKPEFTEQVEKLCLLGATDEHLADFFGVHPDTVQNWKKSHPEFFESIKRAKQVANQTASKSLYHRALGYTHMETKVFCNDGEITTHEVEKHYPPDTAACIFWLKNRDPKNWRDKIDHEMSGPGGGPIQSSYVITPVKPKELPDAKEQSSKDGSE